VLGDGWVASIAAKKTRFTQDDTATAFATIEKYVGEWRLAYTAYITRLEGGSWSPTHRGTASWNRGDFNYVTFNAARGREVENVVPVGLVTSDVTTYSIGAGIEIAARWGLTFEWAHQKQGDFYTRRSARLGTRLVGAFAGAVHQLSEPGRADGLPARLRQRHSDRYGTRTGRTRASLPKA